ncbi:MAG: formate/nitrite transporter family protein [Planctomycetes bacterium]|nr:formate/nitrite transporter family protein [Planctomycetota bacterium]
MAERAEEVGVAKASLRFDRLLALSILAGSFIALGGTFALTAGTGSGDLPYGVGRLLVGLVFSLGLVLVVVGGAELFTGNNLLVMAWASGKVSTVALLRNWAVVFLGNFVGSVATAGLLALSGFHEFAGGSVATTAVAVARLKVDLGFGEAIIRGVLCNVLVCLAVWLTFSARSTVDRVAVIVPPISAFVACGFEHSVANMFFVPYALFLPTEVVPVGTLSWTAFLVHNLLPVTIGNVLGGGVLVGAVYWFIYLRRTDAG